MNALLDGLGSMFGLIGLAIAIDIFFNDGESIARIIKAIRGKEDCNCKCHEEDEDD